MKSIVGGSLIVTGEGESFRVLSGYAILYGEKIERIVPEAELFTDGTDAPEHVIDAQGDYVSPGFVNVHIHGAMG
ncbi:MAG: N-acetylglucosamine-6-phosphate deacetylase, partial [Schwartzia sp.]|nr:N-acetylglucosamine-6-phosphate deacetylase [Schwartzia sp. (in: firmicutes)]